MRLQGIGFIALGGLTDLVEECDLCLVTKDCKYGAEPHFLHAYSVSTLATSLPHILGPALLMSFGFGVSLVKIGCLFISFLSFSFFPMQSKDRGGVR